MTGRSGAGRPGGKAAQGWIAHPRQRGGVYDRKDPRQRQARRDDTRAERWALRRAYRSVTDSKRVAACGRPGLREDGSALLRVTDATGTPAQHTMGADGRVAGFAGLFHCGNVWVCMECAPRVGAHRASELEQVLGHYIAAGGTAMLVTLTMRHWRKHALAECLQAKAKAWRRVNTGRAWQDHKEITGFVGYCAALEITESAENGWHPHVHAVMVFKGQVPKDRLDMVAEGMFARWSSGLVAAGMPAPSRENGLDVQHLDMDAGAEKTFESAKAWARYVTKGIAAEAVLGASKEAKGTNRSIKELMRDALVPQPWENATTGELVQTIDLEARARLHEYETAIKGFKQMNWSKGLREGAQLDAEVDDEEIVQADLDGEDVAVIPRESWPTVEPRAPELLAVTEREGAAGAWRWLDELGVIWWRPTKLTAHQGTRERDGLPGLSTTR